MRGRFLDQFNARSSHYELTPRADDIAFVAIIIHSSLMALLDDRLVAPAAFSLLAAPCRLLAAPRPAQPDRTVVLWRSTVDGRTHSLLQHFRSMISLSDASAILLLSPFLPLVIFLSQP